MCPINVLEGEDILEMISNKFEELEIDEVDDLFESDNGRSRPTLQRFACPLQADQTTRLVVCVTLVVKRHCMDFS